MSTQKDKTTTKAPNVIIEQRYVVTFLDSDGDEHTVEFDTSGAEELCSALMEELGICR